MGYELGALEAQNLAISASKEWLLTDGHGGFAMGTPSGINTRRYHGHWVPAIESSIDRWVLLASVEAKVEFDQEPFDLSTNQYAGTIHPDGFRRLKRFYAEKDSCEWNYTVGSGAVRKRLQILPEGGVIITYENRTPRRMLLTLNPLVCHKPYHQNFRYQDDYPNQLEFDREQTRVIHDGISLVLGHEGAQRVPFAGWYYRFEHTREVERGLDPTDDLYCPCELKFELAAGETATLTASLGDSPPNNSVVPPSEDLWQVASEKFVVQDRKTGRKSIIAGYPWFTDWGRDTMIALPGLCLIDGDVTTAKEILTGFASQLHEGLIPNRFVENQEEPEYNTVDATLWFINAIYRTLEVEWDEIFARSSLAIIREIIDWHQLGTLYGIHVDPSDGLLSQGSPGSQLTWMDAKIQDWVVTPRYGKPIEINGLWINALGIAAWLCDRLGEPGSEFKEASEFATASFTRKFWSEHHGWYFDTIDPVDAQLRPNQVIAMALPFTPCQGSHAEWALAAVDTHLLTPYGLRTLGREEIHYNGRFEGKLHELDASYHQGTVWPWLLGSYVEAILKHTSDFERASQAMVLSSQMLDEFGMGGIAEVYDGDAPHRPNGCPWQAWSVAEIRRARALLKQ